MTKTMSLFESAEWKELVREARACEDVWMHHRRINRDDLQKLWAWDGDDDAVIIPRHSWQVWEWKTDYAQNVLDSYPRPENLPSIIYNVFAKQCDSEYGLHGDDREEKIAELAWIDALDESQEETDGTEV